MKCWICANETEYPFKFGTHGRAYCSETCSKGERHVTHPNRGGSATVEVAPDHQGPAQFSLFQEVRETDASGQP